MIIDNEMGRTVEILVGGIRAVESDTGHFTTIALDPTQRAALAGALIGTLPLEAQAVLTVDLIESVIETKP